MSKWLTIEERANAKMEKAENKAKMKKNKRKCDTAQKIEKKSE